MLLATVLSLGTGMETKQARAQEAAEVVNREYPIKAAFLYHFSTYISWESEDSGKDADPFVIAVVGKDPLGPILDKIATTKKVRGRVIEVRRFEDVEAISECHLLFIPRSVESNAMKPVMDKLQSTQILCVGETDDFIEQGGAVEFFNEGNKIRFAINTELLADMKLKVSSKLLSLAKENPAPAEQGGNQ